LHRLRQKVFVGNALPNYFYPEAGGNAKAAYYNTKKPGNTRCRAFLHHIYYGVSNRAKLIDAILAPLDWQSAH
jgi:hypothetical protein